MYRITIEELEVKEWEEDEKRTIDERPYTQEELDNANVYWQSKQEKGETDFKKIYEFVSVKKKSEKWVQIYQQLSDSIDIESIVLAVMSKLACPYCGISTSNENKPMKDKKC